MARLSIPTGKPQILNESELKLKYLLEHTLPENETKPTKEKYISAYVVEIKITKVNKRLHFPLIVSKDPKTHTNKNINEVEGQIMTVDNITLEDFVKFQNIECDVLRGYKWTGEKDKRIQELIQKLHKLRCKYKVEKNPLQEVIKLIMNSAYGKTIQKPIETTFKYKKYETRKQIRK